LHRVSTRMLPAGKKGRVSQAPSVLQVRHDARTLSVHNTTVVPRPWPYAMHPQSAMTRTVVCYGRVQSF
jgi:hypothetical protein